MAPALAAIALVAAGRPAAQRPQAAAHAAADHLAIANVTTAPSLDGRCDDLGYVDTVRRTIWLEPALPGGAVDVQIARTPTHVFLCLAGLTADPGTFAAVYVDPDESRDAVAQAGDTMVSLFQPGAVPAVTTRRGDGAGGYEAFAAPTGAVGGASAAVAGGWSAEVRLSVAFLGGDRHGVGLAAAQMWTRGAPGNDVLWPAGARWNAPDGWAAALLDIGARRAVATASHDAFVRRTGDVPDDAGYGTLPRLIVGSRSMGDFYFTWRSYVAVPRPALPPGSTVVAATLELWQASGDSPDGQPMALEACRAAAAWSEGAIGWANQPNVVVPCVETRVGRAPERWAHVDVTGFAAAWYAGGGDHGVRLRRSGDEGGAQHRRDFASRDEVDAVHRPRLVVQFLPSAVPTVTPGATATRRPPATAGPTPQTATAGPTPQTATAGPTPQTATAAPSDTMTPAPSPTATPPPTATPTEIALPRPSDLACTPVGGAVVAIVLTWADHSFEDAFDVERSDAGGPWRRIATLAANTTRYQDFDVQTNTAYGYRVLGVFEASGRRSEPSDPTSCSIGTPRTPPRNLRCLAHDFDGGARWSVELSWLNDVAYDRYVVERAVDGGPFERLGGETAHPGRSAFDVDVPSSRRLAYRVRGQMADGGAASDASEVAECTTFPRPGDAPVLQCHGVALAAKPPPDNWGIYVWWRRMMGTATHLHLEHEAGGAWGEVGELDLGERVGYLLGDQEPAFAPGTVVRLRARWHRHGADDQFSAYSAPVSCAARFERKPVLIVPGYGGSQLTSCFRQSFGGQTYAEFENVWLPQSLDITDLLDGYLDLLDLGADGRSPPMTDDGAPACLHVRGDRHGREGAMMRLTMSWLVKTIVDDDILEGMHDHLLDLGYRDGVDLFFAPYDFRQGVSHGADVLAVQVAAVRAATGADQVDLIGHSMGGLVARRYVLDRADHHVRQIITLGTPYLGAPKATANLLHPGDLGYTLEDKLRYYLDIDPSQLLGFIRTWRGTYDLVPSPHAFGDPEGTGRGGRYVRVQPAHSTDVTWLDEPATTAYLAERTAPTLAAEARAEVERLGDLSVGVDDVVLHAVVGTGIATVGEVHDGWHWLIDPDGGDDALLHHVQGMPTACGDGTVPMDSALGANSLDLYRHGRIHFVRYVEHMALPAHDQVQYLVGELLQGKQVPRRFWNDRDADRDAHGANACYDRAHDAEQALRPRSGGATVTAGRTAPSTAASAMQVAAGRRVRLKVVGDVSVVVTDTLGRTSPSARRPGPAAGDGIPRLTRTTGTHGTVVEFEAAGRYTITLRSVVPRALARVRIAAFLGATAEEAMAYGVLSLGAASVATLVLPIEALRLPDDDPVLRLRPSPGAGESARAPLARLAGAAVDDATAPTLTVRLDPSRLVTLDARDDAGGAGVEAIYVRTGPSRGAYRRYDGPFRLTGPGAFVTAFALDRAGNASPLWSSVHAAYLPRVTRPGPARAGAASGAAEAGFLAPAPAEAR